MLYNEIIEYEKGLKEELDERIDGFKKAFNFSGKKFFMELAFCILTPQSKALSAWKIIETLDKNNLLYTGDFDQIVEHLNTIRFKNTKAKRLILLREQMTVLGKLNAKEVIFKNEDIFSVRKWIVDNINGMGLKEASHFLRNVGFGDDIAILDRHILRILKELKVIDEIPKTLSYNKYLEIEKKMREFSKKIGIRMDRLDLVLWHKQVGYMFK